MNVGKTLFAQIMEFVPWRSFGRIVERYAGNSGVRHLNCAEQFRVMAFGQLTGRESLRDIEVTRTNRVIGVFGRILLPCSSLALASSTSIAI
jgi:hypothetical protein